MSTATATPTEPILTSPITSPQLLAGSASEPLPHRHSIRPLPPSFPSLSLRRDRCGLPTALCVSRPWPASTTVIVLTGHLVHLLSSALDSMQASSEPHSRHLCRRGTLERPWTCVGGRKGEGKEEGGGREKKGRLILLAEQRA